MEKVLSGIRPTGYLHIGNYFGALCNYVKMQYEYECYFFVADWHSLTTHLDTSSLKKSIYRVIAEHLACGLNPQKAVLYIQSQVPEIAELYLIVNMLASKGELEKTVSFKEKIKLHKENITAGLLTYPTLMAADILIHRATKVPVGKDQEQHLEMTRNLAQRFNHYFGNTFPEPIAFNYGHQLLRIPSLDGLGKMSKSENQMSTLYLHDEDSLIHKKVMKALTDAGPTQSYQSKPDYIENLFFLMRLVSKPSVIEKFEDDYNRCIIRYGDMKKQLSQDMVQLISPIRQKAQDIFRDEEYLLKVIKEGKEKARHSADATLQVVRKAMKMNFGN
ncbi:MAG: tryptophan--tRNA ligase [Chitinophagaceae bacterium]